MKKKSLLPSSALKDAPSREHIRHEIYEFALYALGLQKKLGLTSEDAPDDEPEEGTKSA